MVGFWVQKYDPSAREMFVCADPLFLLMFCSDAREHVLKVVTCGKFAE